MRTGRSELREMGAFAAAELCIDGSGAATVSTGSGFMDHMLNSMAKLGSVDISASAGGNSLYRYSLLGSAIGASLDQALGDRSGIRRYGFAAIPMDDALAEVALDLGGRAYLVMRGSFHRDTIGDLNTFEIKSVLKGITDLGRLTLHVRFDGENDHHIAESIFKALGLAIRNAVEPGSPGVLSTKGVI
ncbi:imidazoleglycerol-phosphate dehydratase [Methanothrix sp.]|uniref:imidazoleglycerol-phosphate dehydratase n=1 Tax=Methanothrix sp. TaxID=90426 RepID=UPI002C442474|nr:imidazoleglycerol-phosphate dehydratase [Methanothrix sp.]HOK57654.1 imidazoleglycerol-phosphate dehydratase [Methanothrix sp.]HOL42809.1 imidazoleglycerol-phosphate dehydratase [Methanothrix sp.]HPO87939.1 imidazoleglycerol-phosphate dehydratase [Methanothrix sp.]